VKFAVKNMRNSGSEIIHLPPLEDMTRRCPDTTKMKAIWEGGGVSETRITKLIQHYENETILKRISKNLTVNNYHRIIVPVYIPHFEDYFKKLLKYLNCV
jgi:hypothetical protein